MGWPQVWPCVAVLVVVFERGLRNGLLEQCWVVERGVGTRIPVLFGHFGHFGLIWSPWFGLARLINTMPCHVRSCYAVEQKGANPTPLSPTPLEIR